MKKAIVMILAVLMLISLAACAPQQETASQDKEDTSATDSDSTDAADSDATDSDAADAEAEPFVVGITTFSTATVFSRNAREVLKTKITEKGGEYIDNVATDTLSRTDAIDNFVAQGVDAIILLSGDVSECEESLNAAKEKGIAIGSCDAGFVDAVDIYTSSDNYAIGEQVVGALVDAMGGSGKVLQIYNDVGSMDRKRKGGAADIVAQNENVSIEYQMVYAWPDYFDDIKSKMEAIILSDGKDINGVFATFDGVGLAALQAVREAGLEAQMPIVGVDGEPEALNEIADPDSAYAATVIQSWDDCAGVCVNEIFNKLNGNELSTNQILVPGILVTKENVAEIKSEYPELFEDS
jgi:ABC-type sugar transport system substrate-binding protein